MLPSTALPALRPVATRYRDIKGSALDWFRDAARMRAFHGAFTVQVRYSGQDIVVFGDWAFDRGTYRYTLTPKSGGAPIPGTGKYLWLYRRHPDGSWKQSRVIWNSSDPMPTGGV
jgi:ketosteroid isomerase-like protein